MAGIGFELRKILKRQTLFGVARAYAYAGLISSGPLILSIFGILIIGVMSLAFVIPKYAIVQFQVSVTYLIACSLILTGPLQLSFTRFISDRIFEKRDDLVLSNYNGVVLVSTAASGVLGVLAVAFGFRGEPLMYRLLMVAGFVVVSNIWIAVIFLSSVKQYRQILFVFAIGYGCTVAFALMLNTHGLSGLLGGFVAGHVVLLAGLSGLIYRNYRSPRFISFEVFQKRFAYPSLAMVGFLFNLGVWLDKFMFWYAPGTGSKVIGPLNASVIYDIPVFIAYVCVMPGMATFLVRIEADSRVRPSGARCARHFVAVYAADDGRRDRREPAGVAARPAERVLLSRRTAHRVASVSCVRAVERYPDGYYAVHAAGLLWLWLRADAADSRRCRRATPGSQVQQARIRNLHAAQLNGL